ncbi:hypothetical protein HDV00_011320 [Rhizophlyctis rosea]|nr:hypothetical protein HDV00_011320 [Rhizophlyctis rosea]
MKVATILTAFAAFTATAVSASPYSKVSAPSTKPPKDFVYRKGQQLMLNDKTFYHAGSNCYYLFYAPKEDVDALFADAQALGLKTIRLWMFAELGRNGDPVTAPTQEGYWDPYNENWKPVWFQRFNNQTKQIEYNDDSSTGLGRMDYVFYSAAKHNVKIVPVFTNNWTAYGGIDWYVQVYSESGKYPNIKYHNQFFTEPVIRQAYKDYVKHAMTRVNKITGKRYVDDPVVFGWELANEARCNGWGSAYSNPQDGACSSKDILKWADEMSTYIKSIDPHHLVLFGDEGFYNRTTRPYNYVWSNIYDGSSGYDTGDILALPNIDVGTFHGYMDAWTNSAYAYLNNNNTPGADLDPYYSNNTVTWIWDHAATQQKYNKPVIFEEMGVPNDVGESGYSLPTDDRRVKDTPVFNAAVRKSGIAASWYWQLNSKWKTSPTGYYNGTDPYSVFRQDPNIDIIITDHAKLMELKNYPDSFWQGLQ